jgi:hypothetical protein
MPRNAAPQHPLRRRDRQNAPDPCPRALRARSPFCGRTDSHHRTSPLNTPSTLTSRYPTAGWRMVRRRLATARRRVATGQRNGVIREGLSELFPPRDSLS